MQLLIMVYSVCHSSRSVLDISWNSKIDLLNFLASMVKTSDVPIPKVTMIQCIAIQSVQDQYSLEESARKYPKPRSERNSSTIVPNKDWSSELSYDITIQDNSCHKNDITTCYMTLDSRYLKFQGTLWNISSYPYLDISDLKTKLFD